MRNTPTSIHGYFRDVFEQSVDNASFLWLLRATALAQPHYLPAELIELEDRIQNNLNALHTTSTEDAWEICKAGLEWRQAGEVFTAAIFAFRSLEVKRIQQVVETAFSHDNALKGLISALAWLPAKFVDPWLDRFIKSKDLDHKYLAIAVYSARRQDPGPILFELLQREDCLAHSQFHARAMRLIGELKLKALMPAINAGVDASDEAVAFWARWSALLLGNRHMLEVLEPTVVTANPFQQQAIDIVMRCVNSEQGRRLVSALSSNKEPSNKEPANKELKRATINACSVFGDPQVVPWLLQTMEHLPFARIAGAAFTHITGIYLEENDLAIDVPDIAAIVPNDDPQDEDVSLDPDENLPWPNVEKLKVLWQQYGQQYASGKRYFLGKAITPELLQHQLQQGYQAHRHSAAMELALLDRSLMLRLG